MQKTNKIELEGCNIVFEQHGSMNNTEKVVLFCHGFPGTNRLIKLADALKNDPISIIEINYRGDEKSQGKFSFLGSKKDILAVANHLKSYYNRVPLCALGYSMGGFYVASLLNDGLNLFDEAILLNPVVDTQALFSNKPLMSELWGHANNTLSLYKPGFYEEEIAEINKNHNPIDIAHRLRIPISIVQSTADEVLDPEIAKNFFAALNCEKKYFEVPNAKHDLTGNEQQLLKAIIE